MGALLKVQMQIEIIMLRTLCPRIRLRHMAANLAVDFGRLAPCHFRLDQDYWESVFAA